MLSNLRKILLIVTFIVFSGSLIVGSLNSHCFHWFPLFSGAFLLLQALWFVVKNERFKSLVQPLHQVLLPLAIALTPVIILIATYQWAGMQAFLEKRLAYYILAEAMLILLLLLSGEVFMKEKGLSAGKLGKNLISLLSAAFIVRLFWIITYETQHLVHFSIQQSFFRIEFIVLASIPLFIAAFLLTLRRNPTGYWIGLIVGGAHTILTSILVCVKINPGYGPLVVIPSSLVIALLCGRELLRLRQGKAEKTF